MLRMTGSFLGLFFVFWWQRQEGRGRGVSMEEGNGGCSRAEDWQPTMTGRPAWEAGGYYLHGNPNPFKSKIHNISNFFSSLGTNYLEISSFWIFAWCTKRIFCANPYFWSALVRS